MLMLNLLGCACFSLAAIQPQRDFYMGNTTERVKRWTKPIKNEKRDAGLSPDLYPSEIILSLIHIESDGDSSAHREGAEYHGLLQMGRKAGIDVGLKDKGNDTTKKLLGDGSFAIEMFLRYQERYATLHEYEPDLIALLWKGGPKTLETYIDTREKEGLQEAEEYLKDLWNGATYTYLQNFRELYDFWSGGEHEEVVSTLRFTPDRI